MTRSPSQSAQQMERIIALIERATRIEEKLDASLRRQEAASQKLESFEKDVSSRIARVEKRMEGLEGKWQKLAWLGGFILAGGTVLLNFFTPWLRKYFGF